LDISGEPTPHGRKRLGLEEASPRSRLLEFPEHGQSREPVARDVTEAGYRLAHHLTGKRR
jgi:hypothetical protein